MAYAQSHPQARQLPPGMLAHPLRGVRVGFTTERSGNPYRTDRFALAMWDLPRQRAGRGSRRYSRHLRRSKAAFEAAWCDYLPPRTEADFDEWRNDRDGTAQKYAMWDAGKQLEPPSYGPGWPASRFMKFPAARYLTCGGRRPFRSTFPTSQRQNETEESDVRWLIQAGNRKS
jgi:hypothetical protein